MGEETEAVIVRPARPGDREAVLAFCRHTWEGGDYIPEVWEKWLADSSGALLVAVIKERPVGLVHLAMLSAEDAWIEGIRVDPAERRQGIGRVLTSQALIVAHARGASVARLFTDSDNIASQELVTKKFGFQRVAEVAHYAAKALEAGTDTDADALLETEQPVSSLAQKESEPYETLGPRLLLAGMEDYSRIWNWLEQSNLAPINGGLQFSWWQAWALNEQDFRNYLLDGAVWLLEEWETIQAVAIVKDVVGDKGTPGTLQVRYIDGAAGSIGTLALALREIAQERDLAEVELWLPELLILRDAMNGAGYVHHNDAPMWVYQRSL